MGKTDELHDCAEGISANPALAQHVGLSRSEINEALRLVQEHENEIRSAWLEHFPS